MLSKKSISLQGKNFFQEELLAWYTEHARDLPWRRTHDPYKILVSEMMLQQTPVDRVLPKYRAWLKQFPSLRALSKASTKDILAQWQGLGYNRRALYLQKIAKELTTNQGGRFPRTKEELMTLPGIGAYTAGAIMSFAFKADEPIVDTNVKRVVGRFFMGFIDLQQADDEQLWSAAQRLIPKGGDTYNFNQALMDFGALVCQLRAPSCAQCPLRSTCRSYPTILDAEPAELRYQKKVVEKLYFGYPRRIWRGKILTFLHAQPVSGAMFAQIGRGIQDEYTSRRLSWLKETIDTMVKDGLVEQSRMRVRLPSA